MLKRLAVGANLPFGTTDSEPLPHVFAMGSAIVGSIVLPPNRCVPISW